MQIVSNYRRGYEIERKVITYLEWLGYYCVRSAGSHTRIDVIAIGENDIKLIQVKRTRAYKHHAKHYKRELEEIQSLMDNCPKSDLISFELWVWRDNQGFQQWKIFKDDAVNITEHYKRLGQIRRGSIKEE